MAESVLDQALTRLEANFEAIVADGGTTYWYAPSAVHTVAFFEDRMLDSAVGNPAHIILIRPGDEMHEEYATGSVRATAEVYILICRRFEPATELPPDADTPTRRTVVNRMVRDVMRALWADVQLNGLVINIASEAVAVDREREVEGWAMAEVRLSLVYVYPKATP